MDRVSVLQQSLCQSLPQIFSKMISLEQQVNIASVLCLKSRHLLISDRISNVLLSSHMYAGLKLVILCKQEVLVSKYANDSQKMILYTKKNQSY